MEKISTPNPPSCIRASTSFYNENRTINPSNQLEKALTQQFTKHAYMHDLQANLVCSSLPEGHWSAVLTHITGKKVEFLLGREFSFSEQVPIDNLIAANIQESHQEKLEAVLNNGSESEYWNLLFQNMVGRVIKIVNPILKAPRFVKVYIQNPQYHVDPRPTYEFKVVFSDQTAEHILVNQAGSTSHDIRGLMRAGIRTLHDYNSLSLDLPDAEDVSEGGVHTLYKKLKNQQEMLEQCNDQLMEIFNSALQLCYQTREDYLPENIERRLKKEVELVGVDAALKMYVARFPFKLSNSHLQECKVHVVGQTGCFVEKKRYAILLQFLQNIIKNATEANATSVTIELFDKDSVFHCIVQDNGSGIDPEICSTFFQRKFPTQKASADIEANRGEGSLMVFEDWEMHGGNAVIKNREDGIKGTVVELIIPCSSSPESTEDLDLEVDVKLTEFYKWKESCVDGKVIVIVDDSLIIMKMLFQKIFSILTESKNRSSLFNQVRKHEFEEKGLFFDVFNKTAILCCSNAELAFSVIQKVEICGLITDVQMPGKYDGVGLVSRIREYEKCKQKASIPIVLHSALTASELQSYNPEVVNMHVDYMSKEMDYHQLEKWISSWIEQS